MSFNKLTKRGASSSANNLSVVIFPKTRRVSKAVSGGSRLSFSVLAFAGDGRGNVGFATAKASEVALAQEKAVRKAKASIFKIPLKESRTVCHDIQHTVGATKIIIRSARPGTGIVAGGVARIVAELAGLRDVLIKCIGSTCPHNFALALMTALKLIESPKEIAFRRGRSVRDLMHLAPNITQKIEEEPSES